MIRKRLRPSDGYSNRITGKFSLKRSNHLLDAVFEVANVGICVTDENGKFTLVNDAYCRIYGYKREELIGESFTIVVPEANREGVWNLYEDFMGGLPELAREWKVMRKDGVLIDVLVTAALLIDKEKKKFKVTTVEDLTDLKNNQKHIEFLSTFNVMTNLPNRLIFKTQLKKKLAKSMEDQNLALMYLDIDRFRQINDNYGFLVGDKLLKAFSQRLKTVIEDIDSLGYFGVDQYGLIITDSTSEQETLSFAESIRKKMREPFYIDSKILKISCSIGISFYPKDGGTEEELLKTSEEAMLQAKMKGRNLSYIYNNKMGKTIERKRRIESDLTSGIKRKEFYLVYQPQIDLTTGRIKGVEALIRWKHPELGTVSPAEFIPIAEATGAIYKIGDWTLMEACSQLSKWNRMGINLTISVNLSSYQLKKPNFVERVLRIMKRFHVKPDRMEFELTESAIIDSFDDSAEKIQNLKEYGIRFSIDDFGTGYSSLNYIRKLPLDKLKIDKSFISDLIKDSESGLVTKTIIDMAHNLSFKVIAEGVETVEQMEFLQENDCDEMQGYLFSRPLTSKGMVELWLKKEGEL